ncbi:MAG: hypothetical protein COC17_03685 [Hyphomicrobiales bacterium]|nr:MAG: hypothetical protein COC17_03685 [Hyphomicrobiales bacterium]
MMAITKSQGVTPTERLLNDLAERTFANLWTYPNPFKDDQKELCDLLVVFENRAFIFFDRESRKFGGSNKDIQVTWKRWKKEAIDKQIQTAKGATRYIKSQRPIFLDDKATQPFPIDLSSIEHIHRIVVAHGAKDACLAFSEDNVSGSLAISYDDYLDAQPGFPFMLNLGRNDPVHVLDTNNLEILFSELDTVFDFSAFIEEKERAIAKYDYLSYCGEEDLLAHYFTNFDEKLNRYTIGTDEENINGFMIGEGEWECFVDIEPYKRRKQANKSSYLWDDLINRTGRNALEDKLLGNGDVWNAKSAIHEMAKEPRFSRRALSDTMIEAIQNFPNISGRVARNLSYMPSFYADKAYIFLQVRHDNPGDYENKYRPVRQAMLEIACGAARNKFSHLNTIVGIAIDAPKFTNRNSEDFILMDCSDWTTEQERDYRDQNKELGFFESPNLTQVIKTNSDFPRPASRARKQKKIGRNELCPCRSGKKYKKCCGK